MIALADYYYLSGRAAPICAPSKLSLRGRLYWLRLLAFLGLIETFLGVAARGRWSTPGFLGDSGAIDLLKELAAGLPTVEKDRIHQFLSEYITIQQCFAALRLKISMSQLFFGAELGILYLNLDVSIENRLSPFSFPLPFLSPQFLGGPARRLSMREMWMRRVALPAFLITLAQLLSCLYLLSLEVLFEDRVMVESTFDLKVSILLSRWQGPFDLLAKILEEIGIGHSWRVVSTIKVIKQCAVSGPFFSWG